MNSTDETCSQPHTQVDYSIIPENTTLKEGLDLPSANTSTNILGNIDNDYMPTLHPSSQTTLLPSLATPISLLAVFVRPEEILLLLNRLLVSIKKRNPSKGFSLTRHPSKSVILPHKY